MSNRRPEGNTPLENSIDKAVAESDRTLAKMFAAKDANARESLTRLVTGHKAVIARIAELEAENAGLRSALEAYYAAYTPDGHSAPHDCFATGPMHGTSSDYLVCPGCVAEKRRGDALNNLPGHIKAAIGGE